MTQTSSTALSNSDFESTANKIPIHVNLFFHLDIPTDRSQPGPSPNSVWIRDMVEFFASRGVKPHLGFVGIVAQQLQEDYPETVDKIKEMKLPIGYHPGPGHTPSTVGNPRNWMVMPVDEAIRAQWEFETHNLYPPGHPQESEPVPDQTGGWMTIQRVFGATPMLTDSGGHEAFYRWLGAGYPISYGPTGNILENTFDAGKTLPENMIVLPTLQEPHIFTITTGLELIGGGPPKVKYFGMSPGVDCPAQASVSERLKILAAVQPLDKINQIAVFSHGWIWGHPEARRQYCELIEFILAHPEDYKIIWPDPEEYQWKSENSPLSFYRKKYGVSSIEDMLNVPPPIDEMREAYTRDREGGDPKFAFSQVPRKKHQMRSDLEVKENPAWTEHKSRKIALTKEQANAVAEQLLAEWPLYDHNGDVGGPPTFLKTSDGPISLANAYQAWVKFALEWRKNEKVSLKPIYGPVDLLVYKLKEVPRFNDSVLQAGYFPDEVDPANLPDPEDVNAQGLPTRADYFYWAPTYASVQPDAMMAGIADAAARMTDRVPAVVALKMAPALPQADGTAINVSVNAAEFLYGLAQTFRYLYLTGKPGPVMLPTTKYTSDQVCEIVLPRGGTAGDEFLWRAYLTKDEINTAWLRER